MYKEYEFLLLTKAKTPMLVPYIDSTESNDFKEYGGLNSGVLLKASDAYAFGSGIVMDIGYWSDNNDKQPSALYTVAIQYNASIVLRYSLLSKIEVSCGGVILPVQHIGQTNGVLRFEYLTQEPSKLPVRIGNTTYFAHNPEPLLGYGLLV